MKVISVIEDQDVIKKILQRRTSPQAPGIMGGETPFPAQTTGPTKPPEYSIDYSFSQLPVSDKGLTVDLSACDAQAGPESPDPFPS